jgi:hypothetical protein
MDLHHTNDVADYIAASENPELLGPAWDLIQRTVAARFGQPARAFYDGAQVQMISYDGTPYWLDAWEFVHRQRSACHRPATVRLSSSSMRRTSPALARSGLR